VKILALERELPGAGRDQFQFYGNEEARSVWELHQNGIIRELYFHADQHTAVLVLECASTHEAAAILGILPFAREGLIVFDLIPLTAYSGFSRLFSEEEMVAGGI
jgi:hypothetical protein